jgi:hypothetical protein
MDQVWRLAAMGLTLLGSVLSLAEAIRLPRVGAALKVLFPLIAFYTLPLIMPPQGVLPEDAVIFTAGWLQWTIVLMQAAILVAVGVLHLGILQFAVSRTASYKRWKAVRATFRVYQAVVLLGGIFPLVLVVRMETIFYTGFLWRLSLYELLAAVVMVAMYFLALFLNRVFQEKRTALVLAVVCVCLSSAIELFLLP